MPDLIEVLVEVYAGERWRFDRAALRAAVKSEPDPPLTLLEGTKK